MIVQTRDLVKRYPTVEALNLSSLTIEKGQSFGLVGNNGAGKTTFLRLILDLIRPTEGQITLDGFPVDESSEWKDNTGSFLDESFLIEYLTPEEFFTFVGRSHKITPEEVLNRLAPFAAFFNGEILEKKKYIRDLSQGNKKKIGIAAALIGSPALIVLDEPFANLDPSSQIRLKNILKSVSNREEATLIISSHELNHITEVCQRITVLDKGSIVHDIQTSSDTLQDLQKYFTVPEVDPYAV